MVGSYLLQCQNAVVDLDDVSLRNGLQIDWLFYYKLSNSFVIELFYVCMAIMSSTCHSKKESFRTYEQLSAVYDKMQHWSVFKYLKESPICGGLKLLKL